MSPVCSNTPGSRLTVLTRAYLVCRSLNIILKQQHRRLVIREPSLHVGVIVARMLTQGLPSTRFKYTLETLRNCTESSSAPLFFSWVLYSGAFSSADYAPYSLPVPGSTFSRKSRNGIGERKTGACVKAMEIPSKGRSCTFCASCVDKFPSSTRGKQGKEES